MPGDHHPLAFEGAVDQLRQLILGLCNAMGAHTSNIAIGWPFCPARKIRTFGGTRRTSGQAFCEITIEPFKNYAATDC